MLIDFASEQNRQLLVATHAPDFISEIPAPSLVWIDRSTVEAKQCNEVGRVLADLGALSKADAVRACGANKILFLEGRPDKTVLSTLFRIAGGKNPFDDPEVIVAELPSGKGDAGHLDSLSIASRNPASADTNSLCDR
jgi:hypothetical protein